MPEFFVKTAVEDTNAHLSSSGGPERHLYLLAHQVPAHFLYIRDDSLFQRTLAFGLLNGSTNASRKVQNPARDSLRQPNARSIRTMMTNSTNRVTVHQKLPSFRRKPVKDQALRYILVAINTIKSAQSKRLTTGFMPSPTGINSFCLYYCIMRAECQANSTGRSLHRRMAMILSSPLN